MLKQERTMVSEGNCVVR